MNVGDDWPSALVEGLEKELRHPSSPRNTCRFLKWYENACETKGFMGIEGGLAERMGSMRDKSLKIIISEGSSYDQIRFSALFLTIYAKYEESGRFISCFAEIGEGGVSCLKSVQRKGADAAFDALWHLLEVILMRLYALQHVASIKREGSALAMKVGNLCKQSFNQNNPSLYLLSCVRACLIAFPGSMKNVEGFFRDALGELLMKRGPCQYVAATCFALLPRISGSSETWSQYGQMLLKTIDKIYHKLFEGLVHGDDTSPALDAHAPVLPVTDDAASQVDLFMKYFESLQGLSTSLEELMIHEFSSPVPVPISGIMWLSQRALSVDVTNIRRVERVGRTTGQVAQLGIYVSEVKNMMLTILSKMIMVCQGAILPSLYNLGEMILNALESTCLLKSHASADISDVNVVASLVRIAKCIIEKDGVTGTRLFSKTLVELAKLEIYWTVDGQDSRYFAQRPDRQKRSDQIRHKYAAEMQNHALRLQITIVESLEMMLLHGVSILDHKSRIHLEDFVLHMSRTICDLVHYKSMYTKSNCVVLRELQCAVLKALSASVSAPCVYRPAHAAEALLLFRQNASSSLPELSSICTFSISRLENSMHPRSLSLLPKPDAKETRAREEYGMPSYWSFLEYDGTKKPPLEKEEEQNYQPPRAEPVDVVEEKITQPDSNMIQQGNQVPRPVDVQHKRKEVESPPPEPNKVPKSTLDDIKINISRPIHQEQAEKEPDVQDLKLFDQDSEDSLPEIDSGSDSE